MQTTARKIFVKTHDFGFWTQEPVTVQVKYNGELMSCDHAGATEEEIINEMYNPVTEEHKQWTTPILVCDKCGSTKRPDENWWEDA